MEEIRIPNQATYSPVSLLELGVAAPILSRLLLRASAPGLALQTAALAVYAASAFDDWVARRGVRRIDFQAVFGVDVRTLPTVPTAAREHEVRVLVERLNDGYTAERIPRRDLARRVDRHLTYLIATVTGQRVQTSTEIRDFSVFGLAFPFALGTSDILSGDVAILRDTGIFEPHVLIHELAHRKGYWKELHAQVLSYLALARSDEPVLVQAALAERLSRQLSALAGRDPAAYRDRAGSVGLRPELERQFAGLRPTQDPIMAAFAGAMKELYELRLRATGQNGISDYDVGFTAFLYALERGPHAHRAAEGTARIWEPEPAEAR